jgi:hypothetical protein
MARRPRSFNPGAWLFTRRARRIFLAVLPFSAVFAGLIWATHTHAFAVQEVIVEGNHLVPAAAVLKAARIVPGSNLLAPVSHGVASRLSVFPAVAEARVVRRLPHTAIVEIKERDPWVAVTDGRSWRLLDADWRAIATVDHPPAGVVKVRMQSSPPGALPALGSVVSARPLAGALACLRRSQQPDLKIPIRQVIIDSSHNIWLNVDGLGAAVLGLPDNLGDKLSVLRSILRNSGGLRGQARYLDLQNPEAPAYVPQGTAINGSLDGMRGSPAEPDTARVETPAHRSTHD